MLFFSSILWHAEYPFSSFIRVSLFLFLCLSAHKTYLSPKPSLFFPPISLLLPFHLLWLSSKNLQFSLQMGRLFPYAVEALLPEVKCIYWPCHFSSCAVLFCWYCTALLSAMNRQQSLSFCDFCPKIPPPPKKSWWDLAGHDIECVLFDASPYRISKSTVDDFECN